MPDNNTVYSGLRLPYSPEAEQAVLGAILMEPDAIARVAEILPSSEYFYMNTHRVIYSAMMTMFTSGKAVDQVTVLDTLMREPNFDEASGKTYLVQLAQSCPSIANVENYARIVRDKYDVRSLISAARDIIEDSAGNLFVYIVDGFHINDASL